MSGFYTFVKKQEAIAFPQETFHFGGRYSTEKKEGVRNEQVHMVFTFNDGAIISKMW